MIWVLSVPQDWCGSASLNWRCRCLGAKTAGLPPRVPGLRPLPVCVRNPLSLGCSATRCLPQHSPRSRLVHELLDCFDIELFGMLHLLMASQIRGSKEKSVSAGSIQRCSRRAPFKEERV